MKFWPTFILLTFSSGVANGCSSRSVPEKIPGYEYRSDTSIGSKKFFFLGAPMAINLQEFRTLQEAISFCNRRSDCTGVSHVACCCGDDGSWYAWDGAPESKPGCDKHAYVKT